jgi:CheY-like chemotaxis protein
LEVDGFDVEAVSDGKEALAKINNGDRPDFIILEQKERAARLWSLAALRGGQVVVQVWMRAT